jgi:lipoprotein-anchoring transpeptidase ErfK/SrfK
VDHRTAPWAGTRTTEQGGAEIDARRNTRLLRLLALAAAVPLLAGGCGGVAAQPETVAAAAPVPMSIVITPAAAASEVVPNAELTVRGSHGKLTDVQVLDSEGDFVEGYYDVNRTVWTATENLGLGEEYSVYAVGQGATGTVRETTTFTTIDPPAKQRLGVAYVSPRDGATVGIAQPLVVGLTRPAKDRRAVQDALQVFTEPYVEGAWYWIDSMTLDYRPEKFWPSGTKVTLKADFAGRELGEGIWGTSDKQTSFTIGRHQIIKVNVDTRRMQVVRDGEVIKSFPVSTGKPGWETRNGIKVLSEWVRGKVWRNEAINAPEEYTLYSSYAVRMTNSGEFIHDATWNTSIGASNASHGCVGMNLSDARWVFNNTIMGDPVVTTGSPKPYTNIYNRIADWNIPWEKWKAGNADEG